MKRNISIVLSLLLILLTTMTALAQVEGSYALMWSNIAGGGGTTSSDGFALISTIGQADASTLQGGSYTLVSGFLAGVGSPLAASYRVYLPVILR